MARGFQFRLVQMGTLVFVVCSIGAAPLAAQGSATSHPEEKKERLGAGDVGQLHLGVSTSAGVRPEVVGAGGQANFQLSYRALPWLSPEMILGAGFFNLPTQITNRFAFGARFIWPQKNVDPFLWAAFNHSHETYFDAVMRNPVPALMATAEDGVNHRSGVELGVGAAIPVRYRDHGQKLDLEVATRATAVYLPHFASSVTGERYPASPHEWAFLLEASLAFPVF
jgi:hypothetical protein